MLLAFDTETHLIKPGCLAPKLVCLSWASSSQEPYLLDRPTGLRWLRHALMRDDILIGANIAYDFAVAAAEESSLLPLIFNAYAQDRVQCIQVRQKLIDIANGELAFRVIDGKPVKTSHSLAALVQHYFGEHLEKVDTWRLKYALLDDKPINEWPEDAVRYAKDDAVATLRVRQAQPDVIANEPEQQRAAWALHLMGMWGVRADANAAKRFFDHANEVITKLKDTLKGSGIFRDDGTKDMAEIQRRVRASLERLQIQVPMTPTGKVKCDEETLRLTDDVQLQALAASLTTAKHLGQWGPVIKAAVERPVCARYNVLVESGRTSCQGDPLQVSTNFQNPPRDTEAGDVRGCFVPREGFLFCSSDADTAEIRAHAQNCYEMIGWSKMRDRLIEQVTKGGPDLHLIITANIMGISIEESISRYKSGDEEVNMMRQKVGKTLNFGLMGAMGIDRLIAALKKAGCVASKEQAARYKKIWLETFSENPVYFDIVKSLLQRSTKIVQTRSGRVRDVKDAKQPFPTVCNTFFQGLVADAMEEVLWTLAHECYTGRTLNGTPSVLFGARPVIFLHDEPIVEVPEDRAHECAMRQQEIMVQCLQKWMPDVPVTSSAVLTRRWLKGAKPLFVDGRLVPVRPEKILNDKGEVVKIKWVHDEYEKRAA